MELYQLSPEEFDLSFASILYNNRGYVFYELGEYQQALVDYNDSLELNPEHAHAYYHRGLAYHALNMYSQALADYDRALELDPEDDDHSDITYHNRGAIYLYAEGFQDCGLARENMEHYLELEPNTLLAAIDLVGLASLCPQTDVLVEPATESIPLYYEPFNHTYNFQVNPRTCAITNGSQIVHEEIVRFNDVLTTSQPQEKLAIVAVYFAPEIIEGVRGDIDRFRVTVETELTEKTNCNSVYYLIENLFMDTSGLGNVVFGFAMVQFPEIMEDWIAHADQTARDFALTPDHPDDVSQRRTGRAVANAVLGGEELSLDLIERMAEQEKLQ